MIQLRDIKQDNVKWEFLYSPWALCHSVFQHLHRGDYSPPRRFFHLYSCPTLDISGLTVVSQSCSTFSLGFVAPRESCEENVGTWKRCNKKFHKSSSQDSKTYYYPLILVRSLMSLVSLWVYRLTTFFSLGFNPLVESLLNYLLPFKFSVHFTAHLVH